MKVDDIKIAKMCHEINKLYNKLMGCDTLSWEDLDEKTKDGIMVSVNRVIDNPDITPSEIHDIWVKSKIKQGWKYGDVLCYTNKTHPCLIDYDELSILDKIKDEMFISIVNILK